MHHFLGFLFLVCFVIHQNAQTPFGYPYLSCFNTTFTQNSIYQSSLDLLLSALSSNVPGVKGFYNASVGRPPNDTVYGLFQCRGDVNNDTCRNCVAQATRDIALQYCPFRKAAVIWYEECILRYSDQFFVSVMATQPSVGFSHAKNVQGDESRYNQLVLATLSNTAGRAANASSEGEMFATQEAAFTENQTIYTLAQCTGDLSNSKCGECLKEAIKGIPSCCIGKRGGRVLFPSCFVRYSSHPFYSEQTATPIPSPVNPPPPSGESRASTVKVAAIAAPVTVLLLIFVVGCSLLHRRAKKKHTTTKEDTFANEMTAAEYLQFDFNTVDAATNKFSEENKLGEGGFGEVYKGRLVNGQEIAVKRLSKGSSQGSEEFKNEVTLVAKLQHRNLVTLLGFCMEDEERILIYEYIPNRSLDYFLYDLERQKELNWSKRYNIIHGIVRGILYLHEDSRLKIVHRDLKPSNILLDRKMNPKISDFGMARIIQVDQTQGNTNRIVGTYGYLAPEYVIHGQFSMKSDVYSFGVLVLEIISGRKNSTFYLTGLGGDLLSYAWKLWNNGTPLQLLDPTLKDSFTRTEVFRCIHMGLLCVQEDPAKRPSMASIAFMLNTHCVTLPSPEQPAFFPHSKDNNRMPSAESNQPSANKLRYWSVNEISRTEFHPR